METGCLAEMRERKALTQRVEVRANQGKVARLGRFLVKVWKRWLDLGTEGGWIEAQGTPVLAQVAANYLD